MRRRILQRLRRVEVGIYGDYKSRKDGVFELRLMFGSGYRIDFAEQGDTVIILLGIIMADNANDFDFIDAAKTLELEYRRIVVDGP